MPSSDSVRGEPVEPRGKHGLRATTSFDKLRTNGIVGAFVALLALIGCQQTPAQAPAATTAVPAIDLLIEHHDSDLDFSWFAAPQAATQPALLKLMRGETLHELAKARVAAANDRKARPADAPFFKHQFGESWTRAAETPRLLVLSAELDTFTGGAHGMHGFDAVIWDKQDAERLRFADLFDGWSKARALLTASYCKALDEERKRRRPEPFTGAMFNDCPAIDRQVLVPTGDVDGRVIAIKMLIGPYEAGPYAEGSYELLLDLPPEVVSLVKASYRPAFGYRQP